MNKVVSIKWTDTARDGLRQLPQNVRRGILRKADELALCSNPESTHKPLTRTLKGYRRLTHGRYRAIFKVTEDKVSNGDAHWYVTIIFVAVGKRKQGDRKDIYAIAEKLAKYQILDSDDIHVDEQ